MVYTDINGLTLPMPRLYRPRRKDTKNVENHVNPVMLVFIA